MSLSHRCPYGRMCFCFIDGLLLEGIYFRLVALLSVVLLENLVVVFFNPKCMELFTVY